MGANGGLNGWLVVDKPLGLTSNRVVELVRRSTGTKVGHAGTLDPLATGVLPIALGEATKTARLTRRPAAKRYRFRIRWGVARATDDREGEIVGECSVAAEPRSDRSDPSPLYRARSGSVPPAYSAIKIAGRRAYALARGGTTARPARAAGRNRRTAARRRSPIRTMPISRRWSARAPISVRSRATSVRRSAPWLTSPNLRRLSVGPLHRKPSDFTGFRSPERGHISTDFRVSAADRDGAGRHPGCWP